MFRSLVLTLGLIVGVSASAKTATITDVMARMGQAFVMNEVETRGFNFTKGDQAKYNLQIASFIKGSMEMNVLDVIADGVWIQQNMNLGFAGKQDIRELIDPNTGEIKKYIVNGKEQAPPDNGDIEVIDSKEDTVRVPAGTFTCLYIKAKVKQQGQESEVEQWVNPKAVPVMGMVKMAASSQLGPVTAELTSFKRM
jgi:hypothetical protein